MVAALTRCGALRTNRDGAVEAARDDPVVAAVAGSSNRAEIRDALLHEAMHMVFYTDPSYERACYDYWEGNVTELDKNVWRNFLTTLRYNATRRGAHRERAAGVHDHRARHVRRWRRFIFRRR